MAIVSNMHTHTAFCDGADPPEAMARRAAELGLADIGFSGHSPLAGADWAMSTEGAAAYAACVLKLKKKYEGVLGVWLGQELDSMSRPETAGLDYFIGSVHAVRDGDGVRHEIDSSPEDFALMVREVFGGDVRAFVKRYYEDAAENALSRRPDIVGHFDLPVKYNGDGPWFDGGAAWYRDAALSALAAVHGAGLIFEVNLHPVFCGYRREPFLAPFLLRWLAEHGGRVTVSSDAHSAGELAFRFSDLPEYLRSCGLRCVWQFADGGFRETPL